MAKVKKHLDIDSIISREMNLPYGPLYCVKKYLHIRNLDLSVGDVINIFKDGAPLCFEDGLVKRWKVVCIDELGSPWVRRISRKRGVTKQILPLICFFIPHFNFDINSSFPVEVRLDTGYASSILLGNKFNCRDIYKKNRLKPGLSKKERNYP